MAATSPIQQPTGSTNGRQDRPWLLPTNRRLRNLTSISIRNISISTQASSRPRGKTIDDDAAPNALKSPAKLVALREQRSITQSRSSTDLRKVDEHSVISESSISTNGSIKSKLREDDGVRRTPERPKLGRMRRRSTLEWVNATPQRRQETLERVTKERMVDCFYSLHVEGFEEPAYVSEVVHETMNPNFKQIDLSSNSPAVARLDSLTVRFWVNSKQLGGWRQLLEISLSLQSLQYLGRDLDEVHHRLPPNAVIFRLIDGVYTVYTSLFDYNLPHISPSQRLSSINRILPTSSFDALLRLSKLDDSIQDALATRNKIASDLENLLEKHNAALVERDRVAEAEDRVKTIEFAKKTVEKQLQKVKRQKQEKSDSLRKRRDLMQQDLLSRAEATEYMGLSRVISADAREKTRQRRKEVEGQRRRICEDLQKSYPIAPLPKASLAFTIRGLYLPNSEELDKEPLEAVAAALGHVAHLTLLLSFYLDQPLPYPLTPRSSQSVIEDPLSLLKGNVKGTSRYADDASLRIYPLFSKGVPRFRFEYAVFLLNKDIHVLLENCFNVRVLDIRQTLPNLKYLLYVATAGEGDLPNRKAGGVRGLLKGAIRPSLGSRHGSSDSASSALSGILRHSGTGEANGRPKGAVDSLRKNIGSLDRTR